MKEYYQTIMKTAQGALEALVSNELESKTYLADMRNLLNIVEWCKSKLS